MDPLKYSVAKVWLYQIRTTNVFVINFMFLLIVQHVHYFSFFLTALSVLLT